MSHLPSSGITLGKGCRNSETGGPWLFAPSPTPHGFESDGLDDLDSYYELPDHSCQLELSLPSSKPGSPRRQVATAAAFAESSTLAVSPPQATPAFKSSLALSSQDSQTSLVDSMVGALSLTSADRFNDDMLVYREYDSTDNGGFSDRSSRTGDSQLIDDGVVRVTIVDLDFCKQNAHIFERLSQICGELVPSMILEHAERSKDTLLVNQEMLDFWFDMANVFHELGVVVNRMKIRETFRGGSTLSSAATPRGSGSITPATPKTPTKSDMMPSGLPGQMKLPVYPFDPSVIGEIDEIKDESDEILDLAALADDRPLHYACDSTRESRMRLADFDLWEELCGSLAELLIVNMGCLIPNCESCEKPNWFGLCDYAKELSHLAENVLSIVSWTEEHSQSLALFFRTVALRAWKQQQTMDDSSSAVVPDRPTSTDGTDSSTPSPATVPKDGSVGCCLECAQNIRDLEATVSMK